MTSGSIATLLVFITGAGDEDYGRRLARYHWRRALPADRVRAAAPTDKAEGIFAGARDCVIVRDEMAIPAALRRFPTVKAEAVAPARSFRVAEMPPVHTLRELEQVGFPATGGSGEARPAAVAFSAAGFPPAPGETVGDFLERLLDGVARENLPGFSALVLDDPFGYERPEVTRHLPESIQRLLDVGCGAGAAAAALKRRLPALHVTGIEKHPGAAARARLSLDRVLEGEAADQMRRLAAGTEKFDAFLLADVLEHLEDPIAVLTLARSVAAPEATLVASVPNVGHLSLVRDLLFGRFDPLPSGLLDAGHLRWFTRRFLEEALAEAGWSVEAIEGLPGAPPPDAEAFRSRFADWPELDGASLTTYQWVAVARPAGEHRGL